MVFPRMQKFLESNPLEMGFETWTYFAPPAWFAGIFQGVVSGEFQTAHFIYTLLAICMPMLFIYIVFANC